MAVLLLSTHPLALSLKSPFTTSTGGIEGVIFLGRNQHDLQSIYCIGVYYIRVIYKLHIWLHYACPDTHLASYDDFYVLLSQQFERRKGIKRNR